jgi:hypothetical protein
MKIVRFIKPDLINGICYSPDEIAGWEDWIADNLIKRGYAVLHGDAKPKVVGRRIPDEPTDLEKQIAELKKRAAA